MTEQDLLKKLFNLMEKRVSSTSKDSYVKSLLDQGKVKINEKNKLVCRGTISGMLKSMNNEA